MKNIFKKFRITVIFTLLEMVLDDLFFHHHEIMLWERRVRRICNRLPTYRAVPNSYDRRAVVPVVDTRLLRPTLRVVAVGRESNARGQSRRSSRRPSLAACPLRVRLPSSDHDVWSSCDAEIAHHLATDRWSNEPCRSVSATTTLGVGRWSCANQTRHSRRPNRAHCWTHRLSHLEA